MLRKLWLARLSFIRVCSNADKQFVERYSSEVRFIVLHRHCEILTSLLPVNIRMPGLGTLVRVVLMSSCLSTSFTRKYDKIVCIMSEITMKTVKVEKNRYRFHLGRKGSRKLAPIYESYIVAWISGYFRFRNGHLLKANTPGGKWCIILFQI